MKLGVDSDRLEILKHVDIDLVGHVMTAKCGAQHEGAGLLFHAGRLDGRLDQKLLVETRERHNITVHINRKETYGDLLKVLRAGGWLGVMPGTRVDSDLAELKASMDAVFAAHDKNPDRYREAICKGTEGVISEFRRKPACVGASFYGAPVYRDDFADRNFKFIAEAFDAFTDTYFDTIEKRQNDPVTEQDVIAQNQMRKAWLVDQLFSDPFAREIVPFEIWSFTNVAPEIRF